MENTIERVTAALCTIEREIGDRKSHMESLVESLKERVQGYDAYHIMTFLSGEANEVKQDWDRLRELNEQKSMLEFFLRNEQ